MVQAIILFVIGLVLICIGGDRLVDAAVAIARKLGIPQIVVGATIVSLGTTRQHLTARRRLRRATLSDRLSVIRR